MALYTIDRINRLRVHVGLGPIPGVSSAGMHYECDRIDEIIGYDTTGAKSYDERYSLHKGHMRPPNPVGLRVAKLEVYCFGPRRNPITAAFWPPQGLYHHWLGVEG